MEGVIHAGLGPCGNENLVVSLGCHCKDLLPLQPLKYPTCTQACSMHVML